MLDWNQPVEESTTSQESSSSQEAGPYPPPRRACLVCGKEAWVSGTVHNMSVDQKIRRTKSGTWIYAGKRPEQEEHQV